MSPLTKRIFIHITIIPLSHLRKLTVVITQYHFITSWNSVFLNLFSNLFSYFSPNQNPHITFTHTLHLLVVLLVPFTWEQSSHLFLRDIGFLKITDQEYFWLILKNILDLCTPLPPGTACSSVPEFPENWTVCSKAWLDSGIHFRWVSFIMMYYAPYCNALRDT